MIMELFVFYTELVISVNTFIVIMIPKLLSFSY